MSKFNEEFNEPVAFFDIDSGGSMGYLVSADLYTKEEALKVFQDCEEIEFTPSIEDVKSEYVRYGICSCSFETYNGWFSCKKGRGAKKAWMVEE